MRGRYFLHWSSRGNSFQLVKPEHLPLGSNGFRFGRQALQLGLG